MSRVSVWGFFLGPAQLSGEFPKNKLSTKQPTRLFAQWIKKSTEFVVVLFFSGDLENNLGDFPQLLMRRVKTEKVRRKKRKFCADSRGVHWRDISLIFLDSMLAVKIPLDIARHVLHFTCCYSSETGFPCISLECARVEGEKQSFTLADRFSFRRVGRRKKPPFHGENRLLNFIVRSILDIHFPSLPAIFSLRQKCASKRLDCWDSCLRLFILTNADVATGK